MNVFPYGAGPSNLTTLLSFYPAVYPTCTADATYTNPATKFLSNDPGCFSAFFPAYSEVSYIAGREVVANFHFGVPHKSDGGKDDVQLLYTSSAQYRQYYSGVDDGGQAVYAKASTRKTGSASPPHWPDYLHLPRRHAVSCTRQKPQPIAYLFPGSPTDRCANVFGVPNVVPERHVRRSSQRLSRRPLGYRQHREAAVPEELRQQRVSAALRLHVLLEHQPQRRRRGAASAAATARRTTTTKSTATRAACKWISAIKSTRRTCSRANVNYITSTTLRVNNFNYLNTSGQQVSNLTNGTRLLRVSRRQHR